MTTRKQLFKLFLKNTGKKLYTPKEGNGAVPWQESRVKEFAFIDPVDVS